MMKSRENVQKPVFLACFRHFRPEKSFYKSGSVTLWAIAISNQCAKFYEEIVSKAREIQEMQFFWRKSAVPGIFRKFRQQKSVILTI